MIYDNVLQAMGHTPLVRLNRLSEANAAQILVKFEGVLMEPPTLKRARHYR